MNWKVSSFYQILHREENATNRRYISPAISVISMFSNFQDYHPQVTLGYEDFRRRVNNKNNWFAAHNTLTYETCMRFELLITTWQCEVYWLQENIIRRELLLVGPIMMRTKIKTRPQEHWLAESDYVSWNERSEITCFYKLPCNFPRNIFVPLEDQYKKTFPKQTRAVLWHEATLLVALPLTWHLCL